MDVNTFEDLVKCKVLPPRGIQIPLLPSHTNKKLCLYCAESMPKLRINQYVIIQLAIDLSQALGYLLNFKKQCRLDILC